MAEPSKETQEKIQRLQLLEQQAHQLSTQRQQFTAQRIEIESAMEHLKDASDVFKIIGPIMVNSPKPSVEQSLADRKTMLELRIKNLEKQEAHIKKKAKDLQQEVLREVGHGEN